MFLNTNFIFAGENSEQMYGLKLVRMSGGMIEQTFSGSQKILEDNAPNWDKPTFYGVSRDPLSFDITLSKQGEWSFDEKKEVAHWLVRDEYEDFRPDDYPIVLKVISTGQLSFFNNGNDEGYLTMTFRCDSPNVYTPQGTSGDIDLSSNPVEGTNYSLNNSSNVRKPYYPEIEVTIQTGETQFSIENLSNGSKMEMTGLTAGEKIYIDGNNKVILSDLGNNRVPNLTDLEFLYLSYGNNNLLIKGAIVLRFRWQYPIIL